MKAVIILGDGMSDWPVEALGGKTPLMASRKPHIDRIAREGTTGLFRTIPDGMPNGSAVANLSVLGYDPRVTFSGRGVLEAASMGIELADDDVAMRCNLICVQDGKIKNHSAGHISTDEAGELVEALADAFAQAGHRVSLHKGISYRHLLVLHGVWASPELSLAPPHDHVGESVASLLPSATAPGGEAAAEALRALYDIAMPLLANHPVNQARRAAGKDEANAIWPWSPGRRPAMKTFQERFGVHGAVISAVDLVMGLGRLAGMDVIHVEGATGLWDTNYEGKADACLAALDDHDLVYVHVEATDEAGHAKDLALKMKCIEMLDERLVKRIVEGLEARGLTATIAVLPDHPTPVATGSHASDPVPLAIKRVGLKPDDVNAYDEESVKAGALGLLHGDEFIRTVLDA